MPIGSSTSKKKSITHKMGPKPEQPSPESPAAPSGPARYAATRATRGRGRRARSPHTIAALWPQTRRRARPARLRGLPDADHAHLHATDHTRHAQHPVNSALLANSEFSARLQCPRTRRDGRDCVEPQLSAPPRRRRVVRNDAPRDGDEADDAPRPGAADDGGVWCRSGVPGRRAVTRHVGQGTGMRRERAGRG